VAEKTTAFEVYIYKEGSALLAVRDVSSLSEAKEAAKELGGNKFALFPRKGNPSAQYWLTSGAAGVWYRTTARSFSEKPKIGKEDT
jgi:hypothetical protein